MPRTLYQRISIVVTVVVALLTAVSLIWAFVLRPAQSTSSQPTTGSIASADAASTVTPTKSGGAKEKPLAADQSTLILELFNPSDQALTNQITEASITQQIEQIQTSSFVLRKCDLIDDEEYANTFRALIAYAVQMNLAPDVTAAEKKVRQIAESASTSYSLVYSRTKCDSPALPDIAKQLLLWQEGYLE